MDVPQADIVMYLQTQTEVHNSLPLTNTTDQGCFSVHCFP